MFVHFVGAKAHWYTSQDIARLVESLCIQADYKLSMTYSRLRDRELRQHGLCWQPMFVSAGLVPRRVSPTKIGLKRGRQGGRGQGPAKAQASKKQRLLDPLRATARQSERLAAHTR